MDICFCSLPLSHFLLPFSPSPFSTGASDTADTLFQEVLGRKDKADSTRNALNVLQRFKFLFNLPLNIERNIQKVPITTGAFTHVGVFMYKCSFQMRPLLAHFWCCHLSPKCTEILDHSSAFWVVFCFFLKICLTGFSVTTTVLVWSSVRPWN